VDWRRAEDKVDEVIKLAKENQKGFSLIEIVVGVSIIALVMLGVTVAIVQLVNAGRNSSHMSVVRQVQTAGYWVSRDGVQAQTILDENGGTLAIEVADDPQTEGVEILILQRTDWYTGDVYRIQYSLQDMGSGSMKKLWRHQIITPEEGGTPTVQSTMVAKYIDGSATGCEWTGDDRQAFTFQVSATVEEQTESRTYEIQPRPMR